MGWLPTIRQLEYVVAVADTAGFGRAAQATAVSQPALSKQIKEVEEGLGIVLFERRSRGARPTPEGDLLIERARRVLAEVRVGRLAEHILRVAERLYERDDLKMVAGEHRRQFCRFCRRKCIDIGNFRGSRKLQFVFHLQEDGVVTQFVQKAGRLF